MVHKMLRPAALGCAFIIYAMPAAGSQTVYDCKFDPGASPLATVRMVYDAASGRLTPTKDHIGADASFHEASHSVRDGKIIIFYEVHREGRFVRQDLFEINPTTGAAVGFVELFDEDGNFIRGGPGGVKGTCRIQKTAARAAAPSKAGSSKAGSCHFESGPTQFYNSAEYCVSSVLPSQGGNTYGPRNLHWGPVEVAWCEGAPGNGVGETIRLSFLPNVTFRSLVLRNGYQKTKTTFANNGRIAKVELKLADGDSYWFTLKDKPGEQRLTLPGTVTTNSISLRILSTYRGAKHADTCLTSIHPDLETAEMDPDRY